VIYQNFQKINTEDVLNRRFFPVWFFTNERMASFLQKTLGKNNFKKVFAIGGGGDFAFNILSLKKEVKEIDVCDYRQLATITIDIKKNLFKNLSFKEWEFLSRKNKEEVYKKIEKGLAKESKDVLSFLIKNSKEKDFLKVLKKSRYWYKDSFKQTGEDYLLYFNKESYLQVKENTDKIKVYYGDFFKNIRKKDEEAYDLIYASNIFDNKEYCPDKEKYLEEISKKLKKEGVLILATQYSSKKIKKIVEEKDFKSIKEKKVRFNPFVALLGHYAYSFIAFKKREQ
jgi:SAM-dependent methyltransferase